MELTDELTKFWLEALKDLSPNQVRKGFLKYTQGDNCEFPPKPGQIIRASGYVWSPPPAKINTTRYYMADCLRCGKKHQGTSVEEACENAQKCDHRNTAGQEIPRIPLSSGC